MEHYDLIVLGGGPGGYLAAERAARGGLSTLLIEGRALGGVCLNEGCIPSKTLLHTAKVYGYARHGKPYGVTTEGSSLDTRTVQLRRARIVRRLVAGVGAGLKEAGVTVVEGHGVIHGRYDGLVELRVGEARYAARHLILATGSEPIVPPIAGLDEGLASGHVLTNREILELDAVPPQLAVIGGGVIGLEMAAYYRAAGSEVTVVELLDHIAGEADRELTSALQRSFEREGMRFILGARVTGVDEAGLVYEKDGETARVDAERILLSVGRRPSLEGYGLESLGVHTERGRIVTDQQGRTNVPGVYAVGDVNGVWMLAHAAYREAEVAVNTILGRADRMRYDGLPSVLYTQPELAFVGLTEAEADAQGLRTRTIALPMAYSGRWLAETDNQEGMVKLVFDEARRCLIGCHMLGTYASEIIVAAGMLIDIGLPVSQMKKLIFPHPTVGEILREALWRAWPGDE